MKFLRRKKKQVKGSPTGEERRLPENAAYRAIREAQQKLDTQQLLLQAQDTTAETARRIDRLRRIQRIVHPGE